MLGHISCMFGDFLETAKSFYHVVCLAKIKVLFAKFRRSAHVDWWIGKGSVQNKLDTVFTSLFVSIIKYLYFGVI